VLQSSSDVGTFLQTSVPVDGDLVSFRARVSDLLGDIKDVIGPENILKQVGEYYR